jgi:hypothetical protein
MQPADPHLAEQLRAAVRLFLPQRARSRAHIAVWVEDSQSQAGELSRYWTDKLVVDGWFAEEIQKANNNHRAPDESAVLIEAVGVIALRIAARPAADCSFSTAGDRLPLLANEMTPTFGSPTTPAQLIALGWEAAVVRAFLPRLARQMHFSAQDPTVWPASLPRSTARSTLSWVVGNAIECALRDPGLARQPVERRDLWSPFDLSPDSAISALAMYRRNSAPDRLVAILAKRIAERTDRSKDEVSTELLFLARDINNGFSREELSRDLRSLLVRPHARGRRFD